MANKPSKVNEAKDDHHEQEETDSATYVRVNSDEFENANPTRVVDQIQRIEDIFNKVEKDDVLIIGILK